MSKNKLPKNAKKVFKGQLFETWQWQQKMYDGSAKTFERVKRQDTVQIIAVTGDKIILEHQEQPDSPQPFISLPSGRCDVAGEKPLETAKRELLEETGYTSNDWAPWNTHNPHSKIIWTVYNFIARDCIKKQNQQLDAGERITLKLVNFEELLLLSEERSFRDPYIKNILYQARLSNEFKNELQQLFFGK